MAATSFNVATFLIASAEIQSLNDRLKSQPIAASHQEN